MQELINNEGILHFTSPSNIEKILNSGKIKPSDLGEISKEEAENFQVSDEVRNAYNYKPKGNTLMDNIKMNAYGFFAEYKHHQNLQRMESEMEKSGITSFRDVSDQDLVRMDDIEEAYLGTKDRSIERKRLFDGIKE